MRKFACLLVCVLVVAPRAGAQAPTLRDSAGIHLVSYPASAKGSGAPRQLSATPAVVIGTSDNPDATFASATAAVRLDDGSIVVADGQRSELRLFNASGAFVRKIGHEGEGPGDFRQLTAIFALPGDTILVWDGILSRITRFTREGKVTGTLGVERLPSVASPGGRGRSTPVIFAVGALADGSLMGHYSAVRFNPPTGWYSDSMTVTHVTSEGKYAPLGLFSRGESYSFVSEASGRSTGGFRPFTARTSLAAGKRSLWLTDGHQFALREYSPEGKLLRIVRISREPSPVTPADIETYRKGEREDARTTPMRDTTRRAGLIQFVEELLKWITFPPKHPAWTTLLVSANGDIWARESGNATTPQRWDLFDAAARYRGVVQVPADVEVMAVGADYLLARARDKDDVETVVLYRVR
jgi:hypothetical protein